MLFHCNNDGRNLSQCYVIRKFPVLFQCFVPTISLPVSLLLVPLKYKIFWHIFRILFGDSNNSSNRATVKYKFETFPVLQLYAAEFEVTTSMYVWPDLV